MTLTFELALAKLLTEILGHHTRAGAVAWMVGVITWLVVVHLIGRIIWNNEGQNPQNGTVLCAVLYFRGHSVVVVTSHCGVFILR